MQTISQKNPQRPSLGLALAGASTKALFYIGLLEVWQEEEVPIDLIAASSSGAIVAAAYACGSLDKLRDIALALDRKALSAFLEREPRKGGLYSLDKAETEIRNLLTHGLKFEEVRPMLAFVAADLEKGEQVILSIGDIARAVRITSTLPGIFQPVGWGSRQLVDGGLLTVIPSDIVRHMGMDIVVGVDMKGSKHIFGRQVLNFRRLTNLLKKIFMLDRAGRFLARLEEMVDQSEFANLFIFNDLNSWEERINQPGIFSVLGKSLDLAVRAAKDLQTNPDRFKCDILISPDIKRPGLADFSQSAKLYKLGREYGKRYAPQIKKLIQTIQPKA